MNKKYAPTLIVIGVIILLLVARSRYMPTQPRESSREPTPTTHTSPTMHMSVTSDREFLDMMIPHHQEAIDASIKLQSALSASDSEFGRFLTGVITAQSREVEMMKAWYRQWYETDYTPTGAYQAMMRVSNTSDIGLIQMQYIEDMIHHHEGAIDMARQVQTITEHDEVKALSTQIITSQTQEVKYLRSLLSASTHDMPEHR